MESRSADPAAVVEVDPPLANAIVAMLQRRGCPAWASEGVDGSLVLVPRERRDEALDLISSGMDELAASHERRRPPVPVHDDGDEVGRRMLLPRLRDAGIAILLVPLLVVVLSAVSIPSRYAAMLVLAGIVVIVALRLRARADE